MVGDSVHLAQTVFPDKVRHHRHPGRHAMREIFPEHVGALPEVRGILDVEIHLHQIIQGRAHRFQRAAHAFKGCPHLVDNVLLIQPAAMMGQINRISRHHTGCGRVVPAVGRHPNNHVNNFLFSFSHCLFQHFPVPPDPVQAPGPPGKAPERAFACKGQPRVDGLVGGLADDGFENLPG